MRNGKISKTKFWEPIERSGLDVSPGSTVIERLVRAKLNPNESHKSDYFDLYYFAQTLGKRPARKSVLFCSGGPGELVRDYLGADATYASFLLKNEYSVVIFDLRGAGFSQIPESTDYDKFLTTTYAVEDIETIRRDWLGKDKRGKDKPWDAIVARSYGTILAHRYAAKHPTKVKKLILAAPLSRHMFKESPIALEALTQDALEIYRQSLLSIYESKNESLRGEFGDLSGNDKNMIVRKIFGSPEAPTKKGIFQITEDAFGHPQFVVDEYHRLQKGGVLTAYGLNRFSRDFFKALRDLRRVGALTTVSDVQGRQLIIGRVLRDEVLEELKSSSSESEARDQLHYRVLYGMLIQDGVDPRFLRAWVASGRKDLQGALKAIGGDAHIEKHLNRWLNKIQIDKRLKIEPWDPADYRHNVPTLILKGQADPITASGQAEQFYCKGLKGSRTLISFPGIGHDLKLPEDISDNIEGRAQGADDDKFNILSGAIYVEPHTMQPGEFRAVRATVNGLSLNDKLTLTVKAPRLKEPIKVVGIGVHENESNDDSSQSKPQFIFLIKNTGKNKLEASDLQNELWSIQCTFFSGWVRIEWAEKIDVGAVRPIYGTVTQGGRNENRLYQLEVEETFDKDLAYLGFFIENSTVNLTFRNDGPNPLAGRTIKCVLRRKDFKRTFRVGIPSVSPGEAQDAISDAIPELDFEADEELRVEFSPDHASESRRCCSARAVI